MSYQLNNKYNSEAGSKYVIQHTIILQRFFDEGVLNLKSTNYNHNY